MKIQDKITDPEELEIIKVKYLIILILLNKFHKVKTKSDI